MQPQKGIKLIKDYCLKLWGDSLLGTVRGIFMKVSTYGQMGVASICMLLVGVIWFIVPSYFFIIKKCTILSDSLLVHAMQKAVIDCIEESCLNRPFQHISLMRIKQRFPMIAQINGIYKSEGSLYCSFKVVHPRMIINDRYLFMEDDSVHQIDDFSLHVLVGLPSITIEQEGALELSTECKNCLKKLPFSIFERFAVHWIDHTCIYLRDKQLPIIEARADVQSIFDDRLLNKYDTIKNETMNQRRSVKRHLIVDMRFKNQVIIAQKSVEGL